MRKASGFDVIYGGNTLELHSSGMHSVTTYVSYKLALFGIGMLAGLVAAVSLTKDAFLEMVPATPILPPSFPPSKPAVLAPPTTPLPQMLLPPITPPPPMPLPPITPPPLMPLPPSTQPPSQPNCNSHPLCAAPSLELVVANPSSELLSSLTRVYLSSAQLSNVRLGQHIQNPAQSCIDGSRVSFCTHENGWHSPDDNNVWLSAKIIVGWVVCQDWGFWTSSL